MKMYIILQHCYYHYQVWNFDEIRKNFSFLSLAQDCENGFIFQHEAEYRLFMEAVKGNPGEKRLASQFMTRFFKHFPSLARETINALFDLCEDADVMVSISYEVNLDWN